MNRDNEKPHVLLVDDEVEIVELLAEFLEDSCVITTATNGDDALELVKSTEFDVIVTDQKMPGLSGSELLQHSIELQPLAERVLITAFADLDSVIDSVNEAQVSYYMTKPIDPQQIVLVVLKSAETARLRKTNQGLLEQLQHYNEDLEKKISDRNAELRQLHESREVIIRTAIHNLKNPLQNLSLVFNELKPLLNTEDSSDLFELAEDSLSLMNGLVHDMLMVASLNKSANTLSKSLVEPDVILYASVNSFQPAAAKKDIGLRNTTEEALPQCLLDPLKFREVLDNVISNAIKYTPSGGSVTVHANTTPDKLIIRVQDSGLGMSKDDIGDAFGEFQRLSARPTGNESSTGLGLFIVKKIVEQHGGSVEIDSEGTGTGTTFTITLPLETD